MSEIDGKVRANFEKLKGILLLVRATGGYKYRSLIRASDKEIEEATKQAYADLLELVVSHTVACEMLKELPPSGVHSRLEEFVQRRADAYAGLVAPPQPHDGKIIPFRQPDPESPDTQAAPA